MVNVPGNLMKRIYTLQVCNSMLYHFCFRNPRRPTLRQNFSLGMTMTTPVHCRPSTWLADSMTVPPPPPQRLKTWRKRRKSLARIVSTLTSTETHLSRTLELSFIFVSFYFNFKVLWILFFHNFSVYWPYFCVFCYTYILWYFYFNYKWKSH